MDYAEDIKKLYTAVFESQKQKFGVDERAIKDGVRNLAGAYAANPKWELEIKNKIADFNKPGHRCAYLLKYAMLHTGLVVDVMEQALKIHTIKEIMSKNPLHFCSLGSGPGSDIVAMLFVQRESEFKQSCKASLVDCYIQWRDVFETVVSELKKEAVVSKENFSYRYLRCDLLAFNDEVQQALSNADVVTMIKFLSAAACKDTSNMIKKICNSMKTDAMLLFIDNSAGGFHEILRETATECGFKPVFGPLKHYQYEEPLFNINWRNCINNQYTTRVAVEMFVKQKVQPQNTTKQLQNEFMNYRHRGGLQCYAQAAEYVQFQCESGHSEIDSPKATLLSASSDSESVSLQPGNVAEAETDSKCCIIM